MCIVWWGLASLCELRKCISKQEAFEKCWAHSPLRAVIHCHSPGVATVARRHCRTPPAHRCPRQRRLRQRLLWPDRMGPITWCCVDSGCYFSPPPAVGEQSILLNVSVYVCPHAHICITRPNCTKFPWMSLGLPLAALQYVLYVLFSGFGGCCRVFLYSGLTGGVTLPHGLTPLLRGTGSAVCWTAALAGTKTGRVLRGSGGKGVRGAALRECLWIAVAVIRRSWSAWTRSSLGVRRAPGRCWQAPSSTTYVPAPDTPGRPVDSPVHSRTCLIPRYRRDNIVNIVPSSSLHNNKAGLIS